MRKFIDPNGGSWVAGARQEESPRHHTRWYLVLESPDGTVFPIPEVRWQTRATAERTLVAMSEFELRRRAHIVHERALLRHGASPVLGAPDDERIRTNANAG